MLVEDRIPVPLHFHTGCLQGPRLSSLLMFLFPGPRGFKVQKSCIVVSTWYCPQKHTVHRNHLMTGGEGVKELPDHRNRLFLCYVNSIVL